MRDLFQVVFELKKKEIEMAKQHIEQHQIKLGGSLFLESGSNSKVSLAEQIVSFAQQDYTFSYDMLLLCFRVTRLVTR
jgi:formyltetrahydrofolate synthetase